MIVLSLFVAYFVLMLWLPRTTGVLTVMVFVFLGGCEIARGSVTNAVGAAICGFLWGLPPFLLASIPRATRSATKKV